MENYETIKIEKDKPILKVIFNRPEKANAMNDKMNKELMHIVSEIKREEDYKYIIFTGSGRYFSGGDDMDEAYENITKRNRSETTIRNDQLDRQDFIKNIERLDQITISAINGPMYGAAFSIGMACDFRIMDESATACLPEAQRGLFYSAGGTPSLVHLIGPAKAKELIMLNKVIGAEEALRIGFINAISEEGKINSEVYKIIDKLEESPFPPLRLTKKIINAATPIIGDTLFYEPELQTSISINNNLSETISNFKKK